VKSILLSLRRTNASVTFSLKLLDDLSKLFSALNIASANRRSSDIVLRKNVFILFIVEKHLSGSAVVIGVVSMISADNTLQQGNFGAHCLLLFYGGLNSRIIDEILSSHKGQRVQSAVFLCAAWGKLKQFLEVPSKEILGCIEETVQTPTILLQKGDR
jgi:hypothetical protein